LPPEFCCKSQARFRKQRPSAEPAAAVTAQRTGAAARSPWPPHSAALWRYPFTLPAISHSRCPGSPGTRAEQEVLGAVEHRQRSRTQDSAVEVWDEDPFRILQAERFCNWRAPSTCPRSGKLPRSSSPTICSTVKVSQKIQSPWRTIHGGPVAGLFAREDGSAARWDQRMTHLHEVRTHWHS
jgi:hypothetical protein